MSNKLFLQPKFILTEQILIHGLISLTFFTLPITIFALTAPDFFLTFAFFGGVITLIFLLIKIPIVAKTYRSTHYSFGPTSLSYVEGFLNIEEKTIDYRDVLEVNLVRGVIARVFGLGTIVLSTAAAAYRGHPSIGGIRIVSIPTPEEPYRLIKQMVDEAKTADRQPLPTPSVASQRQSASVPHGSVSVNPELVIRPSFQPILMLIRAAMWLVCQSAFLIFIGLPKSLEVLARGPVITWALVLSALNLVLLFLRFMNYQKTKYEVGDAKLDYVQGFLNVEEKTIDLADVREVNLRKSVLQRMFGMGTVILSTAAHNSRTGLRLHDLEDPDQAYHVVRASVEKKKSLAARV